MAMEDTTPTPTSPPTTTKKTRRSNPGVRIQGSRIYDSENGKTCHQCRQKTMDFVASCKNLKNNKPCLISYCHKCLQNRYGKNAEEVSELESWVCPKCTGICNCSVCMKTRGCKPTGIMVHAARRTGYSSVSDLLQVNNLDNLSEEDEKHLKESVTNKNLMLKSNKINSEKIASATERDSPEHAKVSEEITRKKPKKKGKDKTDSEEITKKDCPEHVKVSEEITRKKLKKKGKDKAGSEEITKKDGPEHVNASEKITRKKPKKKGKDKTDSEGITREASPEHVKVSEEITRKKPKKKGKDKTDSEEMATKKPKRKRKDKTDIKENESHLKKITLDGAHAEHGASNGAQVSRKRKIQVLSEISTVQLNNGLNTADTIGNSAEFKADIIDEGNVTKPKAAKRSRKLEKCNAELQNKEVDAELQLPKSTSLNTIAGVELPAEDIGNALQFLEFCAAFGKVLDMKKGQAESIIRELVRGRNGRRQQYSPIIQILIQLLTLIQEDNGETQSRGNGSWIQALGKCIDESQCKLEDFPSDWSHRGVDGFYKLDNSKRLKLLNFMCDESLSTAAMRDWIADQSSKFAAMKMEARKEAAAAKNKENNLKQKLQDEVAKAVLEKNGAPLSIAEHDTLVSQIKAEAAEAHAEKVEAVEKCTKMSQRSDAVRTEPVALDLNGNAFWQLNGYDGKSNILYQDRTTTDVGSFGDRWSLFEEDQMEELGKYISRLRRKEKTKSEKFQALSPKAGEESSNQGCSTF